MSAPPDEAAVIRWIVSALDELGIEYELCGSLASSIHGDPRQTRDADLVVALDLDRRFARELGELLGDYFSVKLVDGSEGTRRVVPAPEGGIDPAEGRGSGEPGP